MMMDNSAIDSNLQKQIILNVLQPAYLKDVSDESVWRYRWKKISNSFEALARFISGMSTILAFSSGFFEEQEKELSFTAGCLGAASLVLLQYSSYAQKESKERTDALNKILSSVGINQTVPNLAGNGSSSSSTGKQTKLKRSLSLGDITSQIVSPVAMETERGISS